MSATATRSNRLKGKNKLNLNQDRMSGLTARSDSGYLHGEPYGEIAQVLAQNENDPNMLRPWRDPQTRKCYVTRVIGQKRNGDPITKDYRIRDPKIVNNASTLQPRGWIQLDDAVQEGALEETRLWADLASKSSMTIPDAMGTTILQTQKMSSYGSAEMSMDPIRQGQRDRPVFTTEDLPIPFIHADFFWTARDLAVSKRGAMPLDRSGPRAAGRAIMRYLEQLVLGVLPVYTWGGASIYGYLNYPSRLTTTMTIPTGAGWTPDDTLNEFLGVMSTFRLLYRRGPFMVYNSPLWAQYLDRDFSAAYKGGSLRNRLREIPEVADIKTSEFMSGYRMVFVQMTDDSARAIIGMRLQTARWVEQGGMAHFYKAYCCYVPQLRTDGNSNPGILDATFA